MNNDNFNQIVDQAIDLSGSDFMRPVIEKEILHYEIFSALWKSNFLNRLVFQGGTSLRLCRGSSRFSEDIDFAGGRGFSSKDQAGLGDVVKKHIGDKFNLEVSVKDPKNVNDNEGKVNVSKWQVSIQTSPDRPDIPRQRIKIEIANVPAHTKELTLIKNNYQGIINDCNLMVQAETIEEIMADKLIALPACRSYVRHRDIWDLTWLSQQGAQVNNQLTSLKIEDYHLDKMDYLDALDERIESIDNIVRSADFKHQMSRFISEDVLKNTLMKEGFNDYLINTTKELLIQARNGLSGEADTPSFRM